jgi:hypothetical protein
VSALTPSDLDPRALIERIDRGEVPRQFVLLAARGLLPLPQEDLVTVLAHLLHFDDSEVVAAAKASIRDLPPRLLTAVAGDPATPPLDLDRLADAVEVPGVLEALVRNRATGDETVARLARRATAALQEVIVINQERILRTPSILDALLENPALANDVRRRVLETREEFFEKRARVAKDEEALAGLELAPLDPEQQRELDLLLAQAAEAEEPAVATLAVPEGEEEDENDSAWRRILKMTVAQKIQCAFRGGSSERGILIRDRNKLVCSSVVRSPRLTEKEIESFAGMRNVDEEVLRLIGSNRQWMAKYPIMLALARNPKAPIGVVLPLINRLNFKDLKSLTADKNVSDAVRQSARRLFVTRKGQ